MVLLQGVGKGEVRGSQGSSPSDPPPQRALRATGPWSTPEKRGRPWKSPPPPPHTHCKTQPDATNHTMSFTICPLPSNNRCPMSSWTTPDPLERGPLHNGSEPEGGPAFDHETMSATEGSLGFLQWARVHPRRVVCIAWRWHTHPSTHAPWSACRHECHEPRRAPGI